MKVACYHDSQELLVLTVVVNGGVSELHSVIVDMENSFIVEVSKF